MRIEIYEQADFSSEKSDLDLLLDYTINLLTEKGFEVIRYDKSLNPEAFDSYKEYKLPVIVVDGEILCAGSYDFTLFDKNLLNKSSNDPSVCAHQSNSHCASCLNRNNCKKH